MEMRLFITKDSENVINKTMLLQDVIEITLKDNIDVVNPIIVLKDESFNMINYNYCYLEGFNRFYFIRDIQTINSDMFRVTLECDVLESFKHDILNSEATYKSKLSSEDYGVVSNEGFTYNKKITNYFSSIEVEKERTLLLSTLGGVNSGY